MRRQRDHAACSASGRRSHRAGELEAVHAGHLDVADDDVEILARLAQRQRPVGRVHGGHVVAGHRQQRRQQVAEERAVIDQQHALALVARRTRRRQCAPNQSVKAWVSQIAGIDEVGRLAGDDRAAEQARPVDRELDLAAGPRRCRRSRRPPGPWCAPCRRRPGSAAGLPCPSGSRDRWRPAASACRDTAPPACRANTRSCRARCPPAARPAPSGTAFGAPAPARNSSRLVRSASAPALAAPRRPAALRRLADRDLARAGGDAVGIEDHDDAAVAEDGVAARTS